MSPGPPGVVLPAEAVAGLGDDGGRVRRPGVRAGNEGQDTLIVHRHSGQHGAILHRELHGKDVPTLAQKREGRRLRDVDRADVRDREGEPAALDDRVPGGGTLGGGGEVGDDRGEDRMRAGHLNAFLLGWEASASRSTVLIGADRRHLEG